MAPPQNRQQGGNASDYQGYNEFVNLNASASQVSADSSEQFFTQMRLGPMAGGANAVLAAPWTAQGRGGTSPVRGRGYVPGGTSAGVSRAGRAYEGRRRITVTEMFRQLYALDEDSLIRLQQQMVEAGLIEGRPNWGVVDAATRTAMAALIQAAAADPSRDMLKVLRDLTYNKGGDSEVLALIGSGMDPMEAAMAANKAQTLDPIQVSDPNVLREVGDQVGQELLGRNLTEEERSKLFGIIQGKERDQQKRLQEFNLAQANYDSALGIQNSGEASLQQGASEVDAFMNSIAMKESGGNYNAYNPSGATGKYQILRSNWASWARQAGLPGNAPMTPENQDRVARYKMLEYYKMFGNWRDVAIAWYAGPGAVGGSRGNASQGRYPTINQYADSVVRGMQDFAGGAGNNEAAAIVAQGPPTSFEYSQVDPSAEAAAFARANDPEGYAGHQFAKQAEEFTALLAGPGGP